MAFLKITGKFKGLYPVQTINSQYGTVTKRLGAIQTSDAINNIIVFDLTDTEKNKFLTLCNKFKIDEEIEICCNVICRKSSKDGKTAWFTTLNCFDAKIAQTTNDFAEPEPSAAPSPSATPKAVITEDVKICVLAFVELRGVKAAQFFLKSIGCF
jgi:hypothetical protein